MMHTYLTYLACCYSSSSFELPHSPEPQQTSINTPDCVASGKEAQPFIVRPEEPNTQARTKARLLLSTYFFPMHLLIHSYRQSYPFERPSPAGETALPRTEPVSYRRDFLAPRRGLPLGEEEADRRPRRSSRPPRPRDRSPSRA
jgi:hypothetical protein